MLLVREKSVETQEMGLALVTRLGLLQFRGRLPDLPQFRHMDSRL